MEARTKVEPTCRDLTTCMFTLPKCLNVETETKFSNRLSRLWFTLFERDPFQNTGVGVLWGQF